jgi:hypothetical protein
MSPQMSLKTQNVLIIFECLRHICFEREREIKERREKDKEDRIV